MASNHHKWAPKSTTTWREPPVATVGKKEKHAIVVAYWRNTSGKLYFLTGQESEYVEYPAIDEKTGKTVQKTMREWPPAATNAKRDDLIRAELEKINPKAHFVIRILEREVDTPSGKKKERKEKYTIQITNDKHARGFPKGGMNEKDKQTVRESEEEFMKKTAIREFKEEIGYEINPRDLDFEFDLPFGKKQYFVYSFAVDDDTKKEIENSIADLEHQKKGELFDTKFELALEIESNSKNYNGISNLVVSELRKKVGFRGGNRRRVTRKQRKGRNKTRRV